MGVAFSPDGDRLYSASRDGTARIWDISAAAGRDWLNLVGHSDRLFGVAYRPDGAQLATWSHDGTVKLWDAATGAVLHTLSHEEDAASEGNPSYSPDSKRVAIVSGNGATVFDAAKRRRTLCAAPVRRTGRRGARLARMARASHWPAAPAWCASLTAPMAAAARILNHPRR